MDESSKDDSSQNNSFLLKNLQQNSRNNNNPLNETMNSIEKGSKTSTGEIKPFVLPSKPLNLMSTLAELHNYNFSPEQPTPHFGRTSLLGKSYKKSSLAVQTASNEFSHTPPVPQIDPEFKIKKSQLVKQLEEQPELAKAIQHIPQSSVNLNEVITHLKESYSEKEISPKSAVRDVEALFEKVIEQEQKAQNQTHIKNEEDEPTLNIISGKFFFTVGGIFFVLSATILVVLAALGSDRRWLGSLIWRWFGVLTLAIFAAGVFYSLNSGFSWLWTKWAPQLFIWMFQGTIIAFTSSFWGVLVFYSYSEILQLESRSFDNLEGFLFFLHGFFLSIFVIGTLRIAKIMLDNYFNLRFQTFHQFEKVLNIKTKSKVVKAIINASENKHSGEVIYLSLPSESKASVSTITRAIKSLLQKKNENQLTSKDLFDQSIIFFQLDKKDKGYLTAEDFKQANFSDQIVLKAMEIFDPRNTGKITLIQVFQALNILNDERRDFVKTLESRKNLVGILITFLDIIFWIVSMFITAGIYQVNFAEFWIPLSTSLLAFSFVFANSIKNLWENFVFLFVVRPYEIGDRITFNDGPSMYVKSIKFSTTEFTRIDGRLFIIPNQVLGSGIIQSFKRTKYVAITASINLAADTSVEQIYKLGEEIKNFQEEDISHPWDLNNYRWTINGLNNLNTLTMNFWGELKGISWQNSLARLGAETKMNLAIAHFCNELGIKYKSVIQDISIKNPEALFNSQFEKLKFD